MRAISLGALGQGQAEIFDPLQSSDTQAMLACAVDFGAKIECLGEKIVIYGNKGKFPQSVRPIWCANSGQVLRFGAALAALSPHPRVFFGDASVLHRRPVAPLVKGLRQLSVTALSAYENGRTPCGPLLIRGPAQFTNVVKGIDGADSQPVSGLLMLAAHLPPGVRLEVDNPGETPWIDLTLHWLEKLGAQIKHDHYRSFHVTHSRQPCDFSVTIAGDWSSAAFPIVCALMTGSQIKLTNLDIHDVQGDKKFLDLLRRMGAQFEINALAKTVMVLRVGQLQAIDCDINDCVDSIAALAVLATRACGVTKIRGCQVASHKESNRLEALVCELQKLGARVEILENAQGLEIHPVEYKSIRSCLEFDSHADHRIAMALCAAGLVAPFGAILRGAECIFKSFPQFFTQMQRLGAHIFVDAPNQADLGVATGESYGDFSFRL
jgi:3-phosphoshikimate 1-carboxyvinyltransferase